MGFYCAPGCLFGRALSDCDHFTKSKMLVRWFAIWMGIQNSLKSLHSACPNKCSGHGRCKANDVCDCMQNWGGGDCSLRVCPYTRAWHDTAIGTNDAHYYAECANRGICNRDKGLCVCDDGFTGKGCRRLGCPDDCNGHGTCEYIEDLASDSFDKRVNGVPGQKYTLWDQEKIMGCRCDPGFQGYNCAQRMCPKGDDLLTPNQNEMIQAIVTTLPTSSATAEGYLTYFDPYGNAYTTGAILFSAAMDCTTTLLTELQQLPNNVLNTVMVDTVASPSSFVSFVRNAPKLTTSTGTATTFTRPANTAICLIRFRSEPGTTGYQHLFGCNVSPHATQGQHPATTGLAGATCAVHEVALDTSGTRTLSELAPCSNRGQCEQTSGTCKCFTGHVGLACQKQEALV
uniref:Mastigoneme putative n=1 Tax=Albugo laibachii Nc14 TaxID=890382 RepID=F0WWC6_9STRA|nr:mastigoneme putative [Albugo laibachii Nc14]|eukprot:CCA25746.1 mastigoneme putative [Albugo laibachii Nc14]